MSVGSKGTKNDLHTEPILHTFLKVNKQLSLGLIKHGALKTYGEWTRWKWVVSFTPRSIYSGKESPVLFRYMTVEGGTQSQSRHCKEEKNFFLLPRIQFRFLYHPEHSLVTVTTPIEKFVVKILAQGPDSHFER
jgi:hypothetical protein